jgi:hypothetical protein
MCRSRPWSVARTEQAWACAAASPEPAVLASLPKTYPAEWFQAVVALQQHDEPVLAGQGAHRKACTAVVSR